MMILKKQDLTMLNMSKKEGVSRQGSPYLFYEGKFIDDEGNICSLKLGKNVLEDEQLLLQLLTAKNKEVTLDLALYPTGFNLKGTIVKIEL
jgi:hypothetical protein